MSERVACRWMRRTFVLLVESTPAAAAAERVRLGVTLTMDRRCARLIEVCYREENREDAPERRGTLTTQQST